MPDQIATVAGAALLGIGTLFCVLGVYGVIRMPDFYNRVQAAGLVITLGSGSIFLSVLFLGPLQAGLKGIVTAAFLSLTAPMVTHVLARAAYRHGVPLADQTECDHLAEDGEGEKEVRSEK
jgi:multicomponent Na+:H+ antiporter subunit G